MECEKGRNITVEVPGAGLEIAPFEVDFRRQRGKYDYFKGTFNGDVGVHIKDYVLDDGGLLADIQPAYVKIEGERVYPMVWHPKGVKFGGKDTSIELYDPILDLNKALVDIRSEEITAGEVAEKIFEQYREGTYEDRVLKDFELNTSPERDPYVFSNLENSIEYLQDDAGNRGVGLRGDIGNVIRGGSAGVQDVIGWGVELWNQSANIDYDQITALDALLKLSDEVGFDIFTRPVSEGSVDVELVVGKFDAYSRKFHASGMKSNAFFLTDFNISKPARPINTVIVRGKPVHDDLLFGAENRLETVFRWGEERHDYIAHAIVKRGIPHGKKKVYDADVGLEALQSLAESKMAEALAREQAGELVISPAHSSKDLADYRNLSVGDRIQTHPPSVAGTCPGDVQMYANTFTATSVEHHVSDGAWAIRLDVGDSIGSDDVPDAKVKFFDPRSGEYTDPSDLDEGILSPTLTQE